MELRQPQIDALAFALALGALGAAALAFASARNGAALVMVGLCLAGLVAGRIAGVSGRVLLAVSLGLLVILWAVWIDPPTTARRTSSLAHAGGGALAGWALATTLHRRRWPAWGLAALSGVLALTVAWEVGEWVGDKLLTTALIPSRIDSAFDILFGSLGGVCGVALAGLLALRR